MDRCKPTRCTPSFPTLSAENIPPLPPIPVLTSGWGKVLVGVFSPCSSLSRRTFQNLSHLSLRKRLQNYVQKCSNLQYFLNFLYHPYSDIRLPTWVKKRWTCTVHINICPSVAYYHIRYILGGDTLLSVVISGEINCIYIMWRL